MIPAWLNDIVGEFGRQMGLKAFALGDRGTAGVRFENGLTLRLEYANEALMMLVGFAPQNAQSAQAFALRLLTQAHYAGAGATGLRAGYLRRTGEAILVRRLSERSIDLPRLEEAFQSLWQVAREMGGVA